MLTQKVEALTADAAADEQLTLRALAGAGPWPDDMEHLLRGRLGEFPNVKLLSMDLPHAARRPGPLHCNHLCVHGAQDCKPDQLRGPVHQGVDAWFAPSLRAASVLSPQACLARLDLFIQSRAAPVRVIENSNIFKVGSI